MPHYAKERIHLGPKTCTLCRQQVEGGDVILTYPQAAQYIVQECPSDCCREPLILSTWCHKSCCDILAGSYKILADSYETAQIPTWHDLKDLDYATEALYPPPKEHKRVIASITEGLSGDHMTRIMDRCFRQELLGRLPEEVLRFILEYIGQCPPYLRILGESRRLMERLRNTGNFQALCLMLYPSGRQLEDRRRDNIIVYWFAYMQNMEKSCAPVRPMELSINNVKVIEAVYRATPCTKGPWYDLGGTGKNLHRTHSVQLHKKQRPFWEAGLNVKALDNYVEPIQKGVAELLEQIDAASATSAPLNVTATFQVFAFRLMAKLTFSLDFPVESLQVAREALALLDRSQTLLSTFGHVPWVYAIAKYIPGLLGSNAQFTTLADGLVQRRRDLEPEAADLFLCLLRTENNPEAAGFPLSWEARLAIVAGSANASAALTFICFYLATSPKTLSSLQAEVTPRIEDGTFDIRSTNLPILESVILESLRLQAPIPSGEERKTPPEGLHVGKHFVPGDIIIRVPNFAICRDPRYFVQPDDFIPERWTDRKDLVINDAVFRPFGSGFYACVGKALGLMEIRAAIANLAARYSWRLRGSVDPGVWEFSGKDHFAMVPEALPVIFEKR